MAVTDSRILPPGAFRRPTGPGAVERILALILPLAITGVLLLLGGVLFPSKTSYLLAHAGFSFFGAGKFIVLTGAHPDNPFNYWELACLITYMDTLTGIICIYNMDFLYRLPLVGTRLRRIRLQARKALQVNPWLRKQSYLGVVLFVTFPLTGTGAIGAAFMGKFMGLHRFNHLIAISIGGAVGGFTMALLALWLGPENANELLHQPLLMIVLVAILVVVLIFLGRAFMRGATVKPLHFKK